MLWMLVWMHCRAFQRDLLLDRTGQSSYAAAPAQHQTDRHMDAGSGHLVSLRVEGALSEPCRCMLVSASLVLGWRLHVARLRLVRCRRIVDSWLECAGAAAEALSNTVQVPHSPLYLSLLELHFESVVIPPVLGERVSASH